MRTLEVVYTLWRFVCTLWRLYGEEKRGFMSPMRSKRLLAIINTIGGLPSSCKGGVASIHS
jgi:hypothetical protein